ncbi:MAG: hypothetical protein UW04_C0016G0004 [Parcubacteria group bacterium GW2011_GWB1_43_8]|nr:MAG: hypothetical protein UW04_C0016G0004 [Parcubacteria group bacterium GW2011_GWB1_43_8]
MKKDFKKWHDAKTEINKSSKRLFFHEREVWWCSIGVNVGFEQDGKGEYFARPVIVFKKFNNEVFWGIPLSTKIKTGRFYIPVEIGDGVPRVAIISQLRLIDGKRLYQKLGVIKVENYKSLIESIISLCKMP